mgnify:CR=1 FL=1
MDILYVVGRGSQWYDNELLYSLRSIEQNGINVGHVYLVGSKPDFISNAITYIPCNDSYKCKHKNILYKVLTAIKQSDISSHFLISSDDHYYIKQTDFDNLPVYYKRKEILCNNIGDEYIKSLNETRELLQKYHLPIYQTNPHCNTHFDIEVYQQHKNIFDQCFKLPHGGELNCIMGNLLIANGAKPVFIKDRKIGADISKDKWQEVSAGTECISSVPEIYKTYLAQYLVETFLTKSKYEQ